MKYAILLLTVPVLLVAADKPKKAAKPVKAAAAAPASVAKRAEPVTIPAGATQIDSTTWRHTGKDGKTWIYRQTPFGLSRGLEEAYAAPMPQPKKVEVRVTETADGYRFERQSPMGPQVWTRAKADLTAEEQALVEGARTRSAGAPAEKP